MMTKKYIIGFLLYCSLTIGFGQQKDLTVVEVFKKASEAVKKQDYLSFNTQYILYNDYTSSNIHEQYNGFILKNNNINYMRIKNTEFVSYTNYGLKINNDEKAILMEKSLNSEIQESPLSLSNYLEAFENKTIKSDAEHYICELRPGKISQIMLSKVVIYIKKSDFSVTKQQLYYVEKMESKNKDGKIIQTTPRLEILFTPRKKDIKKDDLLVKKETYFTENNGNIKLSKKLSSYKLFKS